jgi:hypothetical protein
MITRMVGPVIRVVGGVLGLAAIANGIATSGLPSGAPIGEVARFMLFVTSLAVAAFGYLLGISGLRWFLLPLIAVLALTLAVMGGVLFSGEIARLGRISALLTYPMWLVAVMTSHAVGIVVLVIARLSPEAW